jgi:ABC-type multidrug transport system permease subunit
MRDIWPISVMFSIIFGVVPPIYYSISVLPAPVEYFAYIVPTTWAAILLKGIVIHDFAGVALPALVFLVEMFCVLGFTSQFSDWRHNRS